MNRLIRLLESVTPGLGDLILSRRTEFDSFISELSAASASLSSVSVGDKVPLGEGGEVDPYFLERFEVGTVIRSAKEHRRALLGRPPQIEEPTGYVTARERGWTTVREYVKTADGWVSEDDTRRRLPVQEIRVDGPVISLPGEMLRSFQPLLGEPLTGTQRKAVVRFMARIHKGGQPSQGALQRYLHDTPESPEDTAWIDLIQLFKACSRTYLAPDLGEIVLGPILLDLLNCIPGGALDLATDRAVSRGQARVVILTPLAAEEAKACLEGAKDHIAKMHKNKALTEAGRRKWYKLGKKAEALERDLNALLIVSGGSMGAETQKAPTRGPEDYRDAFKTLYFGLPKTTSDLAALREELDELSEGEVHNLPLDAPGADGRFYGRAWKAEIKRLRERFTGRIRWIRKDHLSREDGSSKGVTVGTRVRTEKQFMSTGTSQGPVSAGSGVVVASGKASRHSAKKAVGTIAAMQVRFDL